MFVAAMLDAFPEFWPAVQASVASLDLGDAAECRLVAHRDHALTGQRFVVAAEVAHHHAGHDHDHDASHQGDGEPHSHSHAHPHEPAGHGPHRAWADIRSMLMASRLGPAVTDHAVAIFTLLAHAEAAVHGVTEDEVAFHEVGAVDSIVDIVAAAQIIALVGLGAWSSAPLPLGSGRVKSAHGILPVPAPATAILLRGLSTIQDGIAGERVTPTGAAVAQYLLAPEKPSKASRRLARTGTGFGTRVLPGISNCLRVLAFETGPAAKAPGAGFAHRELGVVEFEVDDLSAEDLSAGIDHIRAVPGIHDVIQSAVFGKKGRLASQVRVLVAPESMDAAIEACFAETTTIGLRFHTVQGAVLSRSFDEVELGGQRLRVKLVERPGGDHTAKTEAADTAAEPGHAARVNLRRAAEAEALARLPSITDGGDDGH